MDNEKMTDATQPEKLDLRSLDVAAEQQEKLRQLFPEVFTEGGKVDFDRLKSTLGENVDSGKERYGLNWPGKAECFRTIQTPSRATLRPCREESEDFDKTENLIIEGDNLEVLKLLQKGYLGKIKMIYIDPPYNTGNDFIYPDNYAESLDTYLSYTGQVDSEGKKFSTNPETDGRFHSKWLNMMYPRLFLARNLLRNDGVIFISIDDNEADNLRKTCDEIYGEENFLATLARRTKSGGGSAAHHFAVEHDYVLVYARNKEVVAPLFVPHDPEYAKRYAHEDSKGKYFWDTMERSYTQTKPYKITAPDGTLLEGNWFRSEERFKKDLEDGEVRFLKKENGQWSVQFKQRQAEGRKIRSLLHENEYKSSHDEIEALGLGGAFSFPKPTSLVAQLVQGGCKAGEIVLDFFAGSGTTAQAIIELNEKDGADRKFILVQLPEATDKKEFPTIADVTKERVRRVIKKIAKRKGTQLPLTSSRNEDLGFRVFKLDVSNFKPWDGTQPEAAEGVAKQLELHVDHVLPGRSQEDILTEFLLKSGFPLSTRVQTIQLAGKQVFSVEDGAMLVCLDSNLTPEVIKAMADIKPSRVICLDDGFQGNDQLKTNAVQTMKARGVLSFRTV